MAPKRLELDEPVIANGAKRARHIKIEGPDLSERIAERKQIDAVLDLVGNSTTLESLGMLRRDGRACLSGFLGGLAPAPDFRTIRVCTRRKFMSEPEQVEALVLGSGFGGKLLAWHMADRGGGLPLSSAGGSAAPVPISPACPARMRFGVHGSRIWRITCHSSVRQRTLPRRTWLKFASASATWSTPKLHCICGTTKKAAPS